MRQQPRVFANGTVAALAQGFPAVRLPAFPSTSLPPTCRGASALSWPACPVANRSTAISVPPTATQAEAWEGMSTRDWGETGGRQAPEKSDLQESQN